MLNRKEEYIKMAAVEGRYWWYASLHRLVLRAIKKTYFTHEIVIVDAGCGTGGLIQFLQKNGLKNVSGFDVAEDAVAICRSKGLNIFRDSIVNILHHFDPASIDVMISNDVFYFLDESQRKEAIEAFCYLLKTGGIVILNVPSLKAFSGIHDLSVGIGYRFSKADVKKLFDNKKFMTVQRTYWPFLLSPIIFFARTIQRIKLRRNRNIEIKSDIALPPGWLNTVLFVITEIENRFLWKPWGSSLFCVMKKI